MLDPKAVEEMAEKVRACVEEIGIGYDICDRKATALARFVLAEVEKTKKEGYDEGYKRGYEDAI